ncbi:MAG: DUF3598 family protein [Cyanobacteria bacterium P01_H01_bin.130]
MRSQWECLLENEGDWWGAFDRVDGEGTVQAGNLSFTQLKATPDRKTIHQQVLQFDRSTYPQWEGIDKAAAPWEDWPTVRDIQVTYQSVGQGLLLLETGAFSQGALFVGPYSEFGAELGLKVGDRRVRMVQRYGVQGEAMDLTLIREASSQPWFIKAGTPRTPEELLNALEGHWTGTATTVYRDFHFTVSETALTLERKGNRLQQRTTFQMGGAPRTLTSSARIDGPELIFEEMGPRVTVLLLPDGISSNRPDQRPFRKSFGMELGWMTSDRDRQRLIRRYNEKGEWISLTLIQETKQDRPTRLSESSMGWSPIS